MMLRKSTDFDLRACSDPNNVDRYAKDNIKVSYSFVTLDLLLKLNYFIFFLKVIIIIIIIHIFETNIMLLTLQNISSLHCTEARAGKAVVQSF